ncbi:MAG: M48 family metallopeptidase [Nitrospiraceae bacterium]
MARKDQAHNSGVDVPGRTRRQVLALGGRTLCVCALGGLSQLLSGCYKAPGTARDQMIFVGEDKEMAMGASAFRDVLRQAPLSSNVEVNDMIHRVGERIAKAANRPEYHWEFAVIQDDKTINAFALPGGKVAVFTGLLKYTQNETGLATVIGHEVAHALQRHGAERMSRGILETIAMVGTMAAAASGAMNPAAMIGMQNAYGVGVSLPFNRRQESEADFIGLRLMAAAGYDPRDALPFWERMSGCPRNLIERLCFRSKAAIPEFLSTHPSDVTRMNQIEAWIPDALRFYQTAGTVGAPTESPVKAPPSMLPEIHYQGAS